MTHPAFPPSGSATSFSEELAQALRRSGMTLEQVQDELRKAGTPVAAASLSYWQTGRSVPRRENSLRAVAQLERLFGMPTGHLAELLPQTAERSVRPWEINPKSELLLECMEELGLSLVRWRGVVNHDHVLIGADGQELSITATQLVHSQIDDVRCFPAIYFQDSSAPARPAISAVTNCVVADQIQVPEHQLVVARMELHRTLSRGEPSLHSYRIDCDTSTQRSFRWERSLANRHDHHVSTIEFQGDPPREASYYYRGKGAHGNLPEPAPEHQGDGTALPICAGIIQSVVPSARAGAHGVAWRW
ncbi:hypothetical protein [Luteococcus sp. OSA5]|uniref:hypothetical protein n=1 Tax=Luteococcus sp. OSA5 TaxID=3401630 RepID=UPI003B430B3F